ncbi:MAG: hypothetical protein ABW092_10370 [Candidatus Thiodiazotropha sp.]
MKRIACFVWLITGCSLAQALVAEDRPPDWPCEQVLRNEVPAAVVWAGPSIDGLGDAWEKDKEVKRLVEQFASPYYDLDAADAVLADFSSKQDPSQKDHKLTLLFAGVIQTLNEDRKKKLNGIMRYARGQAARANKLSEELDEMVQLQEDPSPAAQERLALMENEMEIKQRMFDEREDFIQHLCTRPIVVEERLGVLARSIAYYLD